MAPDSPTCLTRSAATRIDFFAASPSVAGMVEDCTTDFAADTRPHKPVVLRLCLDWGQQKVHAWRSHPTLGREAVFGPFPKPPDWTEARRLAEQAVVSARSATRRQCMQAALDAAFAEWATQASRQIADATGTSISWVQPHAADRPADCFVLSNRSAEILETMQHGMRTSLPLWPLR